MMKCRYLMWTVLFCAVLSPLAQAASLEIQDLAPDKYEAVPLSAVFEDLEPYYVDRDYTINTIPDELLAEIEGKEALWVKTGNDDKHNADENFITFSVNANVWVYVAYDRRAAEPPDWVLESYEDMGVDLGTTDVPLGLWKSKEQIAGDVQLHGNDFGGGKGANSNYAFFIVMGEPLAVAPTGKLTTIWGNIKAD